MRDDRLVYALTHVWAAVTGHDWGLFLRSPGFGGVAVLVAATIGFRGVARTVRVQRDANDHVRAAARKDQWWARAEWALDLITSDRAIDRDVGLSVAEALADGEYAAEHEGDVVDAALSAALTSFLDRQGSATTPGSAETPEAQ